MIWKKQPVSKTLDKAVTDIATLNNNKANISSGTFTADVYDNNTKISEIGDCNYIKIGSVYFMYCSTNLSDALTVNTMLQLRNMPCDRVFSGNIYLSGVTGNLGDRTIQSTAVTGGRVYIRPNVTGTIPAGTILTFMFIGI